MIKDIVFLNTVGQEHGVFSKEISVVMMAGKLGTRLAPYTNILPKPLIPIGDYPVAEHIINRFCSYGCSQFYMIVNYKRNMVKAYFDEVEKDYTLDFVEEEKALGTGGGVSLLKGKIRDTFILTNCDILIDDDLTGAYEQHMESGNVITMLCSLKNFTVPYGVVKVGESGVIESMQGKHFRDYKILGTDDTIQEYFARGIKKAFITIGFMGHGNVRNCLYARLKHISYAVPNIIDRTAVVSESAELEDGIFIGKRAVINVSAKIGRMCITNTGVIIEHGCTVGNFYMSQSGVCCVAEYQSGNRF